MILSYSDPDFKPKILVGEKIHSMRPDPHDRWRAGMKINHWMYSPRNPSKNPHEFFVNECISTQRIVLMKKDEMHIHIRVFRPNSIIFQNFNVLDPVEISDLIYNDGFEDFISFREWFLPKGKRFWKGKIIHWTPKTY